MSSKLQRFNTILRKLNLQWSIINEEIDRTPYNHFSRRDQLYDILNHLDTQIAATQSTINQGFGLSKDFDWSQYKRDLAQHKSHISRLNRPISRPTQFARKSNAIQTQQQKRKEIARAKWLATQQKQERLTRARVKQQAFRTNFYRQQAIPKPQRKTFNVYKKTTKRYQKGMTCHGCGEDIDDCEC